MSFWSYGRRRSDLGSSPTKGPTGAVTTFLSVVFSGLLAMNFFEPLAQFLQTQYFPPMERTL